MALFIGRRRPLSASHTARPSLSRRRTSRGPRTERPRLSLVRDGDPSSGPVDLRTLIGAPMPPGVRGALVARVRAASEGGLAVHWWRPAATARVLPGGILLSWTPSDPEGCADVTARLGLAGGEVLLAAWPGLRGDWTGVVRPTVAEVRGLYAALSMATDLLNRQEH